MAKIKVKKPRIVTFVFRQEKTDKDFGSCLWARFHFDTENYALFIESDCGCFSHSWLKEKRGFLEACSEFSPSYLLEELSSMCVVDADKTFDNVKNLVNGLVEYEWDEQGLEAACYCSTRDDVVYEAIAGAISSLFAQDIDLFESCDLMECISTDYPISVKKIVEIYCEHIVPAIKNSLNLLGEDVYGALEEKRESNMRSGIIRRVDDLGRILIPKEIRRTLQIREGDPLEISVEEGHIVIEPYIASGDYKTAIKRIVDNIKQDSTYTEDEKRRASFVVSQLEAVIESLDKEDNNETN